MLQTSLRLILFFLTSSSPFSFSCRQKLRETLDMHGEGHVVDADDIHRMVEGITRNKMLQ